MKIVGRIVRSLVLTALALVAILNSQMPSEDVTPKLNRVSQFSSAAVVVDSSAN